MQIDNNSILSYSGDERLRGYLPVKIFKGACLVFKVIVFDKDDESDKSCTSKIGMCIARIVAALILMPVIVLLALPALIGRCVQLCHYKSLRKQKIGIYKTFESYLGISLEGLPLKEVTLKEDHRLYHWTKHSKTNTGSSIQIFSKKNALRGDGFYLSESKKHTMKYGCCRFAANLHQLKPEEICEVAESCDSSISNWSSWKIWQESEFYKVNPRATKDDFVTAVRQLFVRNGFKAQRYNYQCQKTWDHAVCVYDKECVQLQMVSKKKEKGHSDKCVDESKHFVRKKNGTETWKNGKGYINVKPKYMYTDNK